MKFRITISLLLVGLIALSQDLPKDPQTGLVSLVDSFQLQDQSIQDIQNAISKWSYTLLDPANVSSIYHLDNAKQHEAVSLNFHVTGPLLQEKGNNSYATNGSLGYSKSKTSGLNALAPVVAFGGVKFVFSYTIYRKKLVYEFTNLEYTHDGVHYGKYESEKGTADNANGLKFFGMGKKQWDAGRVEYFDRIKTLADNFKGYIPSLLQSPTNQSGISYSSYQRIKTGATYDEVVKILGDNGKEISNATSQVNGKPIILQAVVWSDLDKSKNITVSFADGKVISKSQSNL